MEDAGADDGHAEGRQLVVSAVLITGGTGYIGSALVDVLSGQRHEIRVLSRSPAQIRKGIRHFHGDVTSVDLLREATEGVSVVFHLAAQTSVAQAEADPDHDRRVNVGAMQQLIDVIRDQGSKAVIVYAGTITQVGLPALETIDERVADQPVTVYDTHKLAAEHELASATRAGHVLGVTLRLANVYGPGPRSGSLDRGVLNQFVRRALAGEPLILFGSGNYLRDYVYIRDVAAAFVAAAEHAAAVAGQHFVIGTGEKRTFAGAVRAVAAAVERRTGRAVPVLQQDEPAAMNAIDRRSYVVDASRFQAATGWRPQVMFDAGLEHTIDAASGERSR